MRTLPVILLLIAVAVSCKKNKDDGFTEQPQLELLSANPTSVKEFRDSIIIMVRYKDLSGDLGRQNPDDNALYIKDQRLPNADYYHIPPLTPDDQKLKTTGTFRIVVPSLFLLGNGGFEKTKMFVKVKDAAGNWSNEIATPELVIER